MIRRHTSSPTVALAGNEPAALALTARTVTAVPLDDDTAAQVIRWHGCARIQVNEQLPLGLRAAVARHAAETHALECDARNCAQARRWLAALRAEASA